MSNIQHETYTKFVYNSWINHITDYTILEIDWIMSSFQHWDHVMIHKIFNVNVLNFVSFSADYALPECLSWFFAGLRALYTVLSSKSMSLWWQIFTSEIKSFTAIAG
jgi:hypothetical protein